MTNTLQFFKCLADDTRLKSLLLMRHHGELCVCDLTSALQLSQPKVSRHLAELKRCELVKDERRGKWVYYRLNPSLPDWALEIIDQALSSDPDYFEMAQERLKTGETCC